MTLLYRNVPGLKAHVDTHTHTHARATIGTQITRDSGTFDAGAIYVDAHTSSTQHNTSLCTSVGLM